MGIPFFFSYLAKNHGIVLKRFGTESSETTIHNLYLDCNSLIYEAVYKMGAEAGSVLNTNDILARVIDHIREYLTLLKPSHTLMIAFDGVAPVAKLEQQRARRFKSLYQTNMTKSILKTTSPDPWNTTAITPGTPFMKQLDARIQQAFSVPSAFGLAQILFSGSNEPGEGEHKIFQYMRDHPDHHASTNTVIYGLDADLIMLSIRHLSVAPRLFLFRETPEFIKSINVELEPNANYLLDIPELATILAHELGKESQHLKGSLDSENGTTQKDSSRLLNDYIFMCFFLGNDFMPHFPSINIRTGGIDKMMMAYKATLGGTGDYLTNGATINWKHLRKLVQFLAEHELDFLKREHKVRDRRESQRPRNTTPEDKLNCFNQLPSYERSVEKFINPYKDNWQARYYKALFEVAIDDDRRRQISVNFLEGLEWTLKYYTQGCPNWRWKYQYHYPPLLCDLLRYIPFFDHEFLPAQPPNPVTDLVQLCYVLPRQSLGFLPPLLADALIQKKAHWYTSHNEFHWAYCKYFWEAHPHLEHIDLDELEAFVRQHVSS